MSIKSDSFSRVVLTHDDATKFKNQVKHGRPKPAAIVSVQRGSELAKVFRANGKIVITSKALA